MEEKKEGKNWKRVVAVVLIIVLAIYAATVCRRAWKEAQITTNTSNDSLTESAYIYSNLDTTNVEELGDKVSYTDNLSVRVSDFSDGVNAAEDIVDATDAKIAESSITDGTRNDEKYTAKILVPEKNYRQAVKKLSALGDVTDEYQEMEDESSEYIDAQAQMEVLKEKVERLEKIADETANTESRLDVENQLANDKYKLKCLEGELGAYDSRDAYSTIYLTITGSEAMDTNTTVVEVLFIIAIIFMLWLIAYKVYMMIEKKKQTKTEDK